MIALTIRQPWASMIATGKKTVEIRSWRTNYRGPLVITASARPYQDYPIGVTICAVDLLDCQQLSAPDLARACCMPYDGWAQHYAWILAHPQPVPPHPVKGRLGLWRFTPPPDFFSVISMSAAKKNLLK